jgi:hypothetical protein
LGHGVLVVLTSRLLLILTNGRRLFAPPDAFWRPPRPAAWSV